MKLKLFIAISVVLIIVIGLVYALIPSQRDEAKDLSQALVSDAVAPIQVDEGPRVALEVVGLSSKNTTVNFSCAKTIAGKTLVVRGGWSDRFGSEIQGEVGIDPLTNEPDHVSASIRIDSLWSEHDQLTEALLTMGFFRPSEHPIATFDGRIRTVTLDTDSTEVMTTVIAGNFELNGITKQIEFPAQVEVTDSTLSITSDFSLDRHVFDVRFKEEGAFGLLTDEDIADKVAIQLRVKVPLVDSLPEVDTVDKSDGQPVEANKQMVDIDDLPETYTETIQASQVQFDMVLVPGDPASGIGPFYIEKHETTWDEFMPWVEGRDLRDDALMGEQRALKLRPSSPYGSIDRNFGMYHRPALGMSRLSAELYCQWLSEQTGRHYRLPTEREWEWAYTSGGWSPDSTLGATEANRVATYKTNSWDDSIGDWMTSKIAERDPNSLGIYDMAGNVAEWVTDTGDRHVVRGGHFESPLSELGVGRIVEDAEIWNRDYPNDPKSQWWYVNARWVGFRVACDAAPGPEYRPE